MGMKKITLETIDDIPDKKPAPNLKHMSINLPYPLYEKLFKTSQDKGIDMTKITILALEAFLK